MPERTVMIVGGGYGQLPAVHAAHRLGWRTVVIDRDPLAPGLALAHTGHVVDVVDAARALEVARSERIDGVLTLQSDIGVPTVGVINDALGTAGVDLETAVTCSRKDLARRRWAESAVPQPEYFIVETVQQAREAAEALGYPCMAKPADSSGSRGVVKITAEEAVAAAFSTAMDASIGGRALLEAFVTGREIGAQTFSRAGRCEVVLLHNDQVSPPPFMMPVGHSYPFDADGIDVPRVEQGVCRAVEALGITHGPANVDLVVTPESQPMLLEIGARVGATCLPELTTLHTGIDWVEAALLACVGESVTPAPKRSSACAAYILEADRDGVFEGYEVAPWVADDPHVLELEVTALPGQVVSRLRKGTDRIGKVVVTGRDAADAERRAEAVRADVRFTIR